MSAEMQQCFSGMHALLNLILQAWQNVVGTIKQFSARNQTRLRHQCHDIFLQCQPGWFRRRLRAWTLYDFEASLGAKPQAHRVYLSDYFTGICPMYENSPHQAAPQGPTCLHKVFSKVRNTHHSIWNPHRPHQLHVALKKGPAEAGNHFLKKAGNPWGRVDAALSKGLIGRQTRR